MQFSGKMGNMMKQVQQAQEAMQKKQEELAELTVEATAGGGMVTVTANGREEIVDISIDPEVIDPEDAEMLEDLVLAAIKEAQSKAKETAQEKMNEVMGDMNLPNIPGLFG